MLCIKCASLFVITVKDDVMKHDVVHRPHLVPEGTRNLEVMLT